MVNVYDYFNWGGNVIINKFSYRKFNIDWIVLLSCLLLYIIFTIVGYSFFYYFSTVVDLLAILISTTFAVLIIDDYKTAFFTSITTGVMDYLVFIFLDLFFHQITRIYHSPYDLLNLFAFFALIMMVTFFGAAVGLCLSKYVPKKNDKLNLEQVSENEESLYDELFDNLDNDDNNLKKKGYCGNCGNKLDNSVNYCTFCGKKL